LNSYSALGYYFTSGLYSFTVLKEEPVEAINLINLTDWGWMLLLSIVVFVVWLLIIFQAKSKGAHEYGQVPDSELSAHVSDHVDTHTESKHPEPETGD
jgi:hypothetical protein